VGVLRAGLLVLHFVGLAGLLGGYLTQLHASTWRVVPAMWHGALTQLITGLGLAGLIAFGPGMVDAAKNVVKLVVLLIVLGLLWIYRARESIPLVAFQGIGVLTVVNIAVAVVWV
jgi:hypothetical protein